MSIYSVSNNGFLFKETYSELSRNHYNSATVILGRTKKKYDLQGTKDHVAIPQGQAGGFGGLQNGYLPEGGSESGGQIEITAKDVVGEAVIERKAMKAAMTDRGAFARFTQRPVQKCVESYDSGCNLLWHLDGTARLGKTLASGAYISGGATAPIIELRSDMTGADGEYNFMERWFSKNLQVNIGNAGDTGVEDAVYTVTSVDTTNKRITLSRKTGSFDASAGANARYVYIQNMFKAAPQGFAGTLIPTTGTIYTLAYDAASWGSLLYDANGAPPSISMINKQFNIQTTRVDEEDLPNFILTSPEIWAILSDIKEGDKRITIGPRDKNLSIEEGFGFSGIAYTTPKGKTIPIIADKHCKKTRMYGIYDEVMYMHHLPDHGWWDEDGKVFMRVPNRPWYQATYGGHFENVIHPTFQIVWDNIGI